MKKKVLIAIVCFFVLTAAVFVFYSGTIFQRGNPLPYVGKMLTLNDSNPFVKVFADEDIYLSRMRNNDALIRHIERTYGVTYTEQMGSTYLFNADNTSAFASTEIYWRKYLVWTIEIHANTTDNAA